MNSIKEDIELNKPNKELKFHDIMNIVKTYKWSIIIITLISIFSSYIYIYFKPLSYVSYSIIRIKANEKTKSEDVISNTISTTKSKDVLEEISLLKTFRINSKALDAVDFKIRYYINDGYKKVEIYGDNIPINITNLTILNKKIIGKVLTIIPQKEGYTLKYQLPYKSKLKKTLFQTNEFELDEINSKEYNHTIENNYFSLNIKKVSTLIQPIHFIIMGEKRKIFERFIHNKLNISQLERDTSLIKISFKDTIPQRATLYVNALTKSFIDYSVESKNIQNSKTLNFILEELTNIKKELKDSEKKLEKHQLSKNIVKPSVQASLYIKKLSSIEVEISENDLKRKLISDLISFIKNNYNLEAIAPAVSKLGDQNTLQLIAKLQNNQIIEEELTLDYTAEYPRLKTIRQQISTIRKTIEYNLNSLSTNINYENTNLLKRKKSYENDMKTLPSKERELVNITRNYEVKSKMYEYLLKKQAENKIIQLATFSDYQIIDNAYGSNSPIRPKYSLILILSILLGLVLGLTLAFLRHSKNNYIKSKNDIEYNTLLPFYGSIPFLKQRKNEIYVNKEMRTIFSESFRTLRTNLQFMSQEKEGTIILISSTIAGEGKSTISANLATILEMAKYKTIIINFDLRKPSLHKFFDVENNKGISTFLNGKNKMEEIIVSTEFANLDFIPSGPIPLDPSELILSKKIPLLFEELRDKYEYIIVDTAPIGIVSDTKTLMQHSDLNLIIIREDYAQKDFINTLEEIVSKHKFKNVGLILNASKAKGGEYGYGCSYEYEYENK